MKLLGREFNAISSPTTTATYVNLADANTVTCLLVGASGTTNATFTVAKDAAGTGAVAFDGAAGHGDGITAWWKLVGSTGLWTAATQAAANTVATTAGTGDITAVEIDVNALPDLFTYIKVSHASATCVWVMGDLAVKRSPANLRSPIV
jgi:hypothetical protein